MNVRSKTVCAASALLIACLVAGGGEFSWIQITDIHYPHADSAEFLQSLAGLGPVPIGGDDLAPAPSFVLATGDLFEFSHGYGWWEGFIRPIDAIGIPVYLQAGNHDNTWLCLWPELRARHGSPWYSFEHGGIRFVGLSSATPQDPRPSFGEEQVRWLERDLAGVARETPIVVFLHHPLGGREFASSWDQDRVLDLLRPFRRVVFLAGHYHNARLLEYEGFDCLVGGQGYQDKAGYTLFHVRDNILTAAYKRTGDAAATNVFFRIDLSEPDRAYVLDGEATPVGDPAAPSALRVRAVLPEGFDGAAAKVEARVNDLDPVGVSLTEDGVYAGEIPLKDLRPGLHRLNVAATDPGGRHAEKTFLFKQRPGERVPGVVWETRLDTGVKASPAAFGMAVAVAGLDGSLRMLDGASGATLWQASMNGEILASPLPVGRLLIVVDGAGDVSAFDAAGNPAWSHRIDAPIYARPVSDGSRVYVVDARGGVTALDASSGARIWGVQVAEYTVEAPVALKDGVLYFGSWDEHVYAVNAADGAVLWKSKGEGSATKPASRYYSPADAPPVVAGGGVFVADRAMLLAQFDAATGERSGSWENCSAVAASEAGDALYLRRTDGRLTRMRPDGEVLWDVQAGMSAVPAPPVESHGVVYAASGGGTVRALSADDGRELWSYQASPGSWMFASPAASGGRVYVVSMDGFVTALAAR